MRGREFKHASICVNKALNSWKVNNAFPKIILQLCFKDLTPVSHIPPKCGKFEEQNATEIVSLLRSDAPALRILQTERPPSVSIGSYKVTASVIVEVIY
jgi:hypothetical protein